MDKAGKSFSVIVAVALSLAMAAALCLPQPVSAAEFHVTTAAEFQAALDAAENNGEDDIICLAAGTYAGHFLYQPPNTEHKSLAITGEPGTSASDIILDGQSSGRVLVLQDTNTSYTGPLADAMVNGITIQNGLRHDMGTTGIFADLFKEYNISISNCIVKNNSGVGCGAVGIETHGSSGSVSLENNLILHNAVTEREGGVSRGGGTWISYNSGSGQITVRNNVIANNSASGATDPRGGGLYILALNVNVHVLGNTIYNNEANQGGGVYFWGAVTANVYNNIVYGNTATEGGDIYLGGLVTNRIGYNNDYSDIWGDWTESGSNFDADPAFVDPANDDYHLTVGSPCIDAGTTTVPDPPGLPATDIEGNHRVLGAAPDIGAYEAWDPWVYDENEDGIIQKTEAIHAIQDYFDGKVTKAQAIEVIMLYFG